MESTRVQQNIAECYDEETKKFDWAEYEYLCQIAEYWDCED